MNLSILQIILAIFILILFFGDISKIKKSVCRFFRTSKQKTRKKGS